jgi:hypothetical protein
LHRRLPVTFDRRFPPVPELEIRLEREIVRNVALFAVSLRVTDRETIELNGGRRRLDY